MSDFIKGPWRIEYELDRNQDHIFWIEDEHGLTVSKCYTPYNADLIVAAPDMYEVLKACEDYLCKMVVSVDKATELLAIVQNAMNKAEGKI